jgi:hypothetical protein
MEWTQTTWLPQSFPLAQFVKALNSSTFNFAIYGHDYRTLLTNLKAFMHNSVHAILYKKLELEQAAIVTFLKLTHDMFLVAHKSNLLRNPPPGLSQSQVESYVHLEPLAEGQQPDPASPPRAPQLFWSMDYHSIKTSERIVLLDQQLEVVSASHKTQRAACEQQCKSFWRAHVSTTGVKVDLEDNPMVKWIIPVKSYDLGRALAWVSLRDTTFSIYRTYSVFPGLVFLH